MERTFKGIPSPDMLKSYIQFDKDRTKYYDVAKKANIEICFFNTPQETFASIYQKAKEMIRERESNDCPTLMLEIDNGDLHPLKLFIYPNYNGCEYYMKFCGGKNIQPFIENLEKTIYATQGYVLNYETVKAIQFSESKTMIHDEFAKIDLDVMNKLLASYKGSDYLNTFIAENGTSYESLTSNLSYVVAFVKTKSNYKDLSLKDSHKVAIQISQTLKELLTGDQETLREFVCDIAYEGSFCGIQFSAKSSSAYGITFDVLQSECFQENNLNSIFLNIYKQAINQTLDNMKNFALNDKQQEIHVRSYLYTIIKEYLGLPEESIQDIHRKKYGQKDFPSNQIVIEIFVALFIPIFTQLIAQAATVPNSKNKDEFEAYELLLNGFYDAVGESLSVLVSEASATYDEGTDIQTKLVEIESRREMDLKSCTQEIEQIQQKLKSYLGNTTHELLDSQLNNFQEFYDELTSHINSINNQIVKLYCQLEAIQEIQAIKEDVKTVSNEDISLKSTKRKYHEMDADHELGDKTVFKVKENRIKHLLEELKKKEAQLQNKKEL